MKFAAKKEEVLKQDELKKMFKIPSKWKKIEIGCYIYWVSLDDLLFMVGKSVYTETTLTTDKDGVKGKEWSVVAVVCFIIVSVCFPTRRS